ncbi:MAG: hypothetical protein AB1847_12350 [bacterium]
MGEQREKQITKGRCYFCNGTFGKAEMAKHLLSCRAKAVSEQPTQGKRKQSKSDKTFHLLVEGRYQPEYWMYIEVKAKATLDDLDEFLRDIWLECCGHMSAFTIDERTFISGPDRESGEEGFDIKLEKILSPKMKFYHEYDFGTTTDLTLKVLSEQEGSLGDWPVQLLARNEAPKINCEVCGKVATQVCSQCIDEGEGWLCGECAEEHECGEDMLLPVVNSPRVGMCGYTGNGDDEDSMDWEDEDEDLFEEEEDDDDDEFEDDDDIFGDDLIFEEDDDEEEEEEDFFEDDEE